VIILKGNTKLKTQTSIKKIFILLIINSLSLHATTINVNGTGTVEITPNTANFDAIIETTAATAKETAEKNAEQTDKVVTLLKQILKEKNAITTANYEVYPDYQYNETTKKSELINFKGRNEIKIKTNDLKNLGELLDQTSNSGVTAINNLQFSYNNPSEIYLQALEKAVLDAKSKATVIANATGIKLKNIKSIDSLNSYSPTTPIYTQVYTQARGKMLGSNADMSSAIMASTPINPNNIKTEATVQIVFDTSN
jgi:uncharacterized protein YggE